MAASDHTNVSNLIVPIETKDWEVAEIEKVGFIVFLAIALIGLLINLRVIYVAVVKLPRRRQRPVNLLVAHLSGVSICIAFVSLFNLCDVVQFINFAKMGGCELIGYLKTLFFTLFSTNVTAIFYERIRTFRECQGKLLINRMLILVWIIPSFASIPTAGMSQARSEFDQGGNMSLDNSIPEKLLGSCKPVPLLGSDVATVVYETLRFMLFHLTVTVYIIYGLLKIRSKLKYLHIISPTPKDKMRRKVHGIRYIYIHFTIFILISLPVGFLVLLRRTLSRVETSFRIEGADGDTLINKCIAFSLHSYFILNPMIYLLLIGKSGVWSSYCSICCIYPYESDRKVAHCIARKSCDGNNPSNENSDENEAVENGNDKVNEKMPTQGNSSRISTHAVTTASNLNTQTAANKMVVVVGIEMGNLKDAVQDQK